MFEIVSGISCFIRPKNADAKLQLNLLLALFQIVCVHGRTLNKGQQSTDRTSPASLPQGSVCLAVETVLTNCTAVTS